MAGLANAAQIELDLLVILDRVANPPLARVVMDRAEIPFAPLRAHFKTTYATMHFTEHDSSKLLLEAQAALRRWPTAADYDAVVVLTDVELVSPTGPGVAGQVICIGGVRHRSKLQSLAVAELRYGNKRHDLDEEHQIQQTAWVVAHELGHLFGARHEHGNCVEAAEPKDVTGSPRTRRQCTVMEQLLFLGGDLKFGAAEIATIRGHVAHYAAP